MRVIYAYVDQEKVSKAFDEMPSRDVSSWNMIFDGYVMVGEINTTFELFEKMTDKNVVSWVIARLEIWLWKECCLRNYICFVTLLNWRFERPRNDGMSLKFIAYQTNKILIIRSLVMDLIIWQWKWWILLFLLENLYKNALLIYKERNKKYPKIKENKYYFLN